MHKGNIQKFTEGAFRNWGYELTRDEFSDVAVGWDDCGGNPGDKILVKDAIADITLQQVLTRPDEFDVIATTNLNGDYLSDALAAQVGGIGIAPGGNINYVTGHGVFEATHGTAPKYAGQDKVNPGLGDPLGRDDVRAPRLAGRRRRHRPRARGHHRRQDRHLRLRPPDGRRHRGQVLGVRPGDRRPPVTPSHPASGNRSRPKPTQMILAELTVRHTRRHMPTRRVALGEQYLPMSGPAHGRGAARRGRGRAPAAALDDEQREELPRLLFDVTRHGITRAAHRAAPPAADRHCTGSTGPGTALLEEDGSLIVELDVARRGRAPGARRGDGRGRSLGSSVRRKAVRAIEAAVAQPGDAARSRSWCAGSWPGIPVLRPPRAGVGPVEDGVSTIDAGSWSGCPPERRWAMEVFGLGAGRPSTAGRAAPVPAPAAPRPPRPRRRRRGAAERIAELTEARELLLDGVERER